MPPTDHPPGIDVLARAVDALAHGLDVSDRHEAERHAATLAALTEIRSDLREIRAAKPAAPETWTGVVRSALAGRTMQRILPIVVLALTLPVSVALAVAIWQNPTVALVLFGAAECVTTETPQ